MARSVSPLRMDGHRPASVASAAPPASTMTVILGIVLAILALYFGREILQPLTLAILFSFALTPAVKRLRK
jgi:predicted PurR-regulated permease PerM